MAGQTGFIHKDLFDLRFESRRAHHLHWNSSAYGTEGGGLESPGMSHWGNDPRGDQEEQEPDYGSQLRPARVDGMTRSSLMDTDCLVPVIPFYHFFLCVINTPPRTVPPSLDCLRVYARREPQLPALQWRDPSHNPHGPCRRRRVERVRT